MKMDLNKSEFSPAKTTDLYDTYWWLAPRYFEELASRPKYLASIESGTMLLITLIAFTGNSLICLAILRKSRLRLNSNKLPHLHIIGNRFDHSLYYFDRSYDRPLER